MEITIIKCLKKSLKASGRVGLLGIFTPQLGTLVGAILASHSWKKHEKEEPPVFLGEKEYAIICETRGRKKHTIFTFLDTDTSS